MSFNLDDYVDVAERVQRFYEKYPEGSLRCKEWRIAEANGQTFFVYVAQAFRTADDGNPAEGIAWEPVPGKTPYTESSEAMVCETSAWGRAIAALGFEVKRGIASKQEVMNRRNGEDEVATKRERTGFASTKQKTFFERLLKEKGVETQQLAGIVRYAEDALPIGRVSKAIEALKEGDEETSDKAVEALLVQATQWGAKQTDMPWSEDE